MYLVMFDHLQDQTARNTLELQRMPQDARLALKKLHIGMIPDPESYLSSFVGVLHNQPDT
jgi:hypothetical protein